MVVFISRDNLEGNDSFRIKAFQAGGVMVFTCVEVHLVNARGE